jgi:hypothetical protein
MPTQASQDRSHSQAPAMITPGWYGQRSQAVPAGRASRLPLRRAVVRTGREGEGTGDDALPDQPVSLYRVTDHRVGPHGKPLAGREECLGLTDGKRDPHHGRYHGPRGKFAVG